MRYSLKAIVLASALSAALVSPAAAASSEPVNDYANQTPYGNPRSTSFKAPPSGYSIFFLQTVSRHGSRPMTSASTEDRALQVWQKADDKNALTAYGKTFARDVKIFQQAEKVVGYGKLSGVGKDEWTGIGRRIATNYRSFFASVKKNNERISSVTTSATRTKQSSDALRASLTNTLPTPALDKSLAKPTEADKLMRLSNTASSAGKAITNEIHSRPAIREYARTLLTTLYSKSYVDSIKDPVGAALDVYTLYQTAPSMQKETNITFARYVPRETREPLSYATDAETFYQYGPGVLGETNSYSAAKPLLADFFRQLDNRINGSSTAAVLRVAHGETTMPFAALIKAPGSEIQAAKGVRFARQKNPWRGAVAGRMAGNIEWVAYRNKAKDVLVTMRYNEAPVRFHSGCKPYVSGSYFYKVSEIKRCLK
ncbi:MAG: histidine-type phosphatase [Aeromicrobium sp.]